jgi:hypothetical protein
MSYKMEELVPIVGELAEKYTTFESTSISYEKAEQLMGQCYIVSVKRRKRKKIC